MQMTPQAQIYYGQMENGVPSAPLIPTLLSSRAKGLILEENQPRSRRIPFRQRRLRPDREFPAGRWPTQAVFWLEWGSSTAGHIFPAARSRFRAVHSDSISTRPAQPVA